MLPLAGRVITHEFWPGVAGVTNTITDGPKTCYDGTSIVRFPPPKDMTTVMSYTHFMYFPIYQHEGWFVSAFL